MQSVTLTRLAPGSIRLARLRSVRPAAWARIALVAMCVAALIGYLVCQMFSGYSMSWYLFALCGFATCCHAWGKKPSKVGLEITRAGPEGWEKLR